MTVQDRTGLPRPRVSPTNPFLINKDDETPKRRPVPAPWINGSHATDHGDFYSFRDDMALAHLKRLCCICGDPLNLTVVLGAYRGRRETSGGWGHPICIRMAVQFCPHFSDMEGTVAWLHEGDGVGVEAPCYETDDVVESALPLDRNTLREIATRDPFGLTSHLCNNVAH